MAAILTTPEAAMVDPEDGRSIVFLDAVGLPGMLIAYTYDDKTVRFSWIKGPKKGGGGS